MTGVQTCALPISTEQVEDDKKPCEENKEECSKEETTQDAPAQEEVPATETAE